MKLIVANWKMNLGVGESEALARLCIGKLPKPAAKVVLCPSFLAIPTVAAIVKKSRYELGAQDCAAEDRGASTGEVSPEDLRKLGCKYVIVGHSERRAIGETDEQIRDKFVAVLRNNMQPILCVGETFAERRGKAATKVVIRQLSIVFRSLHPTTYTPQPIIAYEPVWAIGTGSAATSADATKMHSLIRGVIKKKFPNQSVSILYGGSVDRENIGMFLKASEVDGVLVGGASAKPSFVQLIEAASLDKNR